MEKKQINSMSDAFEMVEILLNGEITEEMVNHAYEVQQKKEKQAFQNFMAKILTDSIDL